jgi:hypothetical protein
MGVEMAAEGMAIDRTEAFSESQLFVWGERLPAKEKYEMGIESGPNLSEVALGKIRTEIETANFGTDRCGHGF